MVFKIAFVTFLLSLALFLLNITPEVTQIARITTIVTAVISALAYGIEK